MPTCFRLKRASFCRRVVTPIVLVTSLFLLLVQLLSKNVVTFQSSSEHQLSSSSLEVVLRPKPLPPSIYAKRLHSLREKCAKLFPNASQQTPEVTTSMFADHRLQYFYCMLPKVACTSFKQILAYANGAPRNVNVHTAPSHRYIKPFDEFHVDERPEILKYHFKFMFVRHPFERLVSAYMNKFLEGHLDLASKHFVGIADDIRSRYRRIAPNSTEASARSNVTFAEFVRYLIDPLTRKPYDIHWRQYYKLCQPCSIRYDFIGRYETLDADKQFVLRRLGIDQLEFPWSSGGHNSSELVRRFFADVPPEHVRQLKRVYQQDFSLFGYTWPTTSDES